MTPETRKSLFVEFLESLLRSDTTIKSYVKRLESGAAERFPELFEGLQDSNVFSITDISVIEGMYQRLYEPEFAQRNKADGNCTSRAALGKYADYLKSNAAKADAVFLYQKPVDKSLLAQGFTIPLAQCEKLFEITGTALSRGEKRAIEIKMLGQTYEATLTSVAHGEKYKERTVIQVRYTDKSPICQALNDVFSYSAQYVAQQQELNKLSEASPEEGEERDAKKHAIICEKEHIDIYASSYGGLIFKCFPVTSELAGDDEPDQPQPQPKEADSEHELMPESALDAIQHVKRYIAAKGFTYPNGLIENFYLSLKAKPFVILAGTSGTGKTRLVKLFAEALGAFASNGRYRMISVRPDWSDSSDLMGHTGLDGQFVPGPAIDFIRAAVDNPGDPYFLCLDEMNLARVEYYLSDFLSVIETREHGPAGIVTDALVAAQCFGKDDEALDRYGEFGLPDNLYVVGTVNMDETTFPFSKKVLDRANTLEFSDVNLVSMPWNTGDLASMLPLDASNEFLRARYLTILDCAADAELVEGYCAILEELNAIMKASGLHVGYRIRDEIVFYLLENAHTNLLPEDQAVDNLIMQKILPRIQGSGMVLKETLCNLFRFCADDCSAYQTMSNDLAASMQKVLEQGGAKYVRSATKIAFMMGRLEGDGFTSYWL